MATIKVTSKHEPYRRAGISHSRQGTIVDTAKLTKKQLEALHTDPHLIVSETFDEALAKARTDITAADQAAEKRLKAATKTKAGLAEWTAALEKAQTDSELTPEAWEALSIADRVERVEAVISAAKAAQ